MNSNYLKVDHPFVTCEITACDDESQFIGTLTYRGFDNGKLSGPSLESVRGQFQVLCDLLDQQGGMLRRGTIMLGYHNDELKGDVLLPDGEVIGFWEMEEDDDTSHFTPEAQGERALSAPSAWMLQDAIADWLGVYCN
ncbi:hypothetical protein [Tritonibacter scottomollicae]|uniref:hypothetical protein n=1 Tax=Tritonibacter scottomollicae TaxID=483013 RepID=UPI003BACA145